MPTIQDLAKANGSKALVGKVPAVAGPKAGNEASRLAVFNAGLAVSNREAIRVIAEELSLDLSSVTAEEAEERRLEYPIFGDAAFDVAKRLLADFSHGKVSLPDVGVALGALISEGDAGLEALALESGESEG